MATDPNQMTDPPEDKEEVEELPPQDQAEDQKGEEEDARIAALAESMGWVPRDKFNGPADAWKPAEQFIRDGKDIQRSLSSDVKALRQQLDVMARTSATIVEQQVEERTKQALSRFNQAVEDGDSKAALAASAEIAKLTGQVNGGDARPTPVPEALTWAQRNSGWFQKDPSATATAFEECDRLARLGYDHQTQLEEAEKRVRREHPHLFGQQGQKPPPGVNSPGSRATQGSSRQKGFSDMPKAAQDIANDMVARGVIPNRDLYAKNYWSMTERKA